MAAIIVALLLIPVNQYFAEQRYIAKLRNQFPDLITTPIMVGPDWLTATLTRTVGTPVWMTRVGAIDVSGDSRRNGNLLPTKIDFDDDDLIEMQRALPHVRSITATRTALSDESISTLNSFVKLKTVFLYESNVSDDGLQQLRSSRRFLVNSNL